MPVKISKDEKNALAHLDLSISGAEVKKDFSAELKKIQSTIQVKGFRKGKVPASYVRRQYGEAVLRDVTNKAIENELNAFMDTQNNDDFIGQIMPVKGKEPKELSIDDVQDIEAQFEIGLRPDFKVQGFDTQVTTYKVSPAQKDIDEVFDRVKKQAGERVDTTEKIENNDLIKLQAVELADGKNKEGGVHTEISLLVDDSLTDEMTKEVTGKSVGDSFIFDVYNLERNLDSNFVKKKILNLENSDDLMVNSTFEFKVNSILRLVPGELNEETLKKFFGKENDTLEKVTKVIRAQMEGEFERSAKYVAFTQIHNKLLELNKENIVLPEDHLVRVDQLARIQQMREKGEQKNLQFPTKEQVVESTQWNLILSQVIKKYDIKVTDEDYKKHFTAQISSYFGSNSDPAIVDGMVDSFLKNPQYLEPAREEILNQKIVDTLVENAPKEEKEVTAEEFQKIVDEFNKSDKVTTV